VPNLPRLKFLPMNCYQSHFLAAAFDFTSFSPWLFGATHFFHSLAVLYRYHFFCNCIFIKASFGVFYLSFSFFTTGMMHYYDKDAVFKIQLFWFLFVA